MAEITKQYAAKMAPHVIKACLNTGIFPSVVLGQMVQEGGVNSKSELAFRYNNPFGHKAFNTWKGEKVKMNGAFWRVYNSMVDAVKSHINILKNPRYKMKGVLLAKTPLEQLTALQKGGYNTGPDKHKYVSLIYNGIIKKNGLEKYDQELLAMERKMNSENGLAFSEQPKITRVLHNLFA